MGNRTIQTERTESLEERLSEVEVIFALAAGYPGEVWVADRLGTIGICEALPKMPLLRGIYFVGGKSEKPDIPHLSVENRDRLRLKLQKRRNGTASGEQREIKVEALSNSNNTRDNLEEVSDVMRREGLQNIAIVSPAYHLPRIRQLCEMRGIEASFIPAEELAMLGERHHVMLEKVVHNYESSRHYRWMELQNDLMMLYTKVDPEYKLIRMFRTLVRKVL